jgi:2-succinyl-5-enolpyruvyl-6-hydroxy-3-cyclohexene-1-carboxylate synthase
MKLYFSRRQSMSDQAAEWLQTLRSAQLDAIQHQQQIAQKAIADWADTLRGAILAQPAPNSGFPASVSPAELFAAHAKLAEQILAGHQQFVASVLEASTSKPA